MNQTHRIEELTPNKANESTTAFDGFPRTAIAQRIQSLSLG
jgi:hypothetical protein